MTSRDFCYWLQGYMEIGSAYAEGSSPPLMTATQVACIQKHLALVFKHEIDPSMPSKELDEIHAGKPVKPSTWPNTGLIRC